MQQLDPDTNGEELTNQPQIINFGGEEVFDNNAEELSENGSKSANSSDKIADKSDCSDKSNSDKSDATHKSSKIVSFCEKKPEIVVDELPIHCDVLTTPEHKKNKDADGKSAAKIDPDSSVGHTPFFKSAATENFLSPDSDKPRSSAGHTPFYHKTPLSVKFLF